MTRTDADRKVASAIELLDAVLEANYARTMGVLKASESERLFAATEQLRVLRQAMRAEDALWTPLP